MATKTFSYSFPAMIGGKTFPLPFDAQGAITVTANGTPVTASVVGTDLVLAVALVAPATIVVSGTTSAHPTVPQAPGTPITPLTVSVGGTAGNVLGAMSAQVSLTNNSGGTSGGNTVAAVTDVPTAANAIATIIVKLTGAQQQINATRDALTALGNKSNELTGVLKAAGIAT